MRCFVGCFEIEWNATVVWGVENIAHYNREYKRWHEIEILIPHKTSCEKITFPKCTASIALFTLTASAYFYSLAMCRALGCSELRHSITHSNENILRVGENS